MENNIKQLLDNINKIIWDVWKIRFYSLTHKELSECDAYFKKYISDLSIQRKNLLFLRKNKNYIKSDVSLHCLVITTLDFTWEYMKCKMVELDNYLTIFTNSFKGIHTELNQHDEKLCENYATFIDSMMCEIKEIGAKKKRA